MFEFCRFLEQFALKWIKVVSGTGRSSARVRLSQKGSGSTKNKL